MFNNIWIIDILYIYLKNIKLNFRINNDIEKKTFFNHLFDKKYKVLRSVIFEFKKL